MNLHTHNAYLSQTTPGVVVLKKSIGGDIGTAQLQLKALGTNGMSQTTKTAWALHFIHMARQLDPAVRINLQKKLDDCQALLLREREEGQRQLDARKLGDSD